KPYEPVPIEVSMTNTGHIPATGVEVRVKSQVFWANQEFLPNYKDIKIEPSRGFYPPGQQYASRLALGPFPPQGITDINAGRALVYVYGRATYSDALAKRGECTFCQVYNPNLKTFMNCSFYNYCP